MKKEIQRIQNPLKQMVGEKRGKLTKIFLKLETWKTLNKSIEIYPVILVITIYVNGLNFSC